MSNLQPPNPEERQPSPIPDSTLARNFSDQLDGLFGLGGELTGLSQAVEDKRQVITTQSRELEELEAKLKATESKLQQVGGAETRVPSGGYSQPRRDVRDVFPDSVNSTTAATSNGASTASTAGQAASTVGGSIHSNVSGQAAAGASSNSAGTTRT